MFRLVNSTTLWLFTIHVSSSTTSKGPRCALPAAPMVVTDVGEEMLPVPSHAHSVGCRLLRPSAPRPIIVSSVGVVVPRPNFNLFWRSSRSSSHVQARGARFDPGQQQHIPPWGGVCLRCCQPSTEWGAAPHAGCWLCHGRRGSRCLSCPKVPISGSWQELPHVFGLLGGGNVAAKVDLSEVKVLYPSPIPFVIHLS